MLIVHWSITIKFRTRKQTSNHKLITVVVCSFVLPYWRISRNTITFHKYFWCSRFCEFHSKNPSQSYIYIFFLVTCSLKHSLHYPVTVHVPWSQRFFLKVFFAKERASCEALTVSCKVEREKDLSLPWPWISLSSRQQQYWLTAKSEAQFQLLQEQCT